MQTIRKTSTVNPSALALNHNLSTLASATWFERLVHLSATILVAAFIRTISVQTSPGNALYVP